MGRKRTSHIIPFQKYVVSQPCFKLLGSAGLDFVRSVQTAVPLLKLF